MPGTGREGPGGGWGAPVHPARFAGLRTRPQGKWGSAKANMATPASPGASGSLRIRPLSGRSDSKEAALPSLLTLGTGLQNPQGLSRERLGQLPCPSFPLGPWVAM